MNYKFDIGDLVTFQKPHMTYEEWKKVDDYPYETGIVMFREKAGYQTALKHIQNAYYHVLLPTGETLYSQREDRLALLAKANT